MTLPVMVDCGVFGLWRKHFSGHYTTGHENRKRVIREFLRSDTFVAHKKGYYDFLRRNARRVRVAVSLDVIGDGEASYELWKEMKEEGFDVLPVFHYGEDFKWLRKYIDQGCSYIGIGGAVVHIARRGPHARDVSNFARSVFRFIPRDVRLHGFGIGIGATVTSLPWYSIDNSTAGLSQAYQFMLVPRRLEVSAEAYAKGMQVSFGRGGSNAFASISFRRHVDNLGHITRQRLFEWIRQRAGDVDLSLFAQDDKAILAFNYYYLSEFERLVRRSTGRPFHVYTVETTIHNMPATGVLRWEKGTRFTSVLQRKHYARCAGASMQDYQPHYLVAYGLKRESTVQKLIDALDDLCQARQPRMRRRRLRIKEN